MPIESADFVTQLDQTSPKGTENFGVIAAHMRLTKKVMRQTFPNMDSECSASASELNSVVGMTSTVLSAMSALQATLEASLLGVNATATAAVQWGSSLKYTTTATQTVTNNSFWFRPYYTP